MQDISDLIKEARPLYFARKKRNNRIKSGLAVLGCSLLVFASWPDKRPVETFAFWDLGYTESEKATYVENLGLPVDDYGLLQVV